MRRYYIIEDNFDVKFRTLAEIRDLLDNLSPDDLRNFNGAYVKRIYESNGIASYDDEYVRCIHVSDSGEDYCIVWNTKK